MAAVSPLESFSKKRKKAEANATLAGGSISHLISTEAVERSSPKKAEQAGPLPHDQLSFQRKRGDPSRFAQVPRIQDANLTRPKAGAGFRIVDGLTLLRNAAAHDGEGPQDRSIERMTPKGRRNLD